MTTDISLFSHSVTAITFAALAAVLLARREQTASALWLVTACLMTFVWAVTVLLSGYSELWSHGSLTVAETLRSGVWVLFVAMLVISNWQGDAQNPSRRVFVGVLAVIALQLCADVYYLTRGGVLPDWGQYFYALGRLSVAIGGLVLTHNLYVNSAPANRWSIRLLCIALAGMFVYDLNLYTLQILSENKVLNADLYEVRGIVNALVAPLIYLSATRNLGLRLQVSRQAAFHTLSFGAIGIYLVAMSLAGYGLRLVGGDWGRFLQISFVFATVITAAVVLVSGQVRAWLRVQINKHLFAYKYDYRQEWLRFVNTVSSSGPGMGDLNLRVVQAVCEPVDSPGGALFVANEDGIYRLLSRWNYRTLMSADIAADSHLNAYFSDSGRIVNIAEYKAGDGDYSGLSLPDWVTSDPRAWLMVPLIHIDAPIGFILIERPLANRELNWEDFDVLRAVGRQAASYVAEAGALAKIAESRKFDEFNRRFAFIMHDIKNLVSQLSLVARNAERHADNPEFRADMVATLQGSVAKMNDLLARLSQQSASGAEGRTAVNVADIAAAVVAIKQRAWPGVFFSKVGREPFVTADPDKIEQILTHLVQNAVDASNAGGRIDVTVTGKEDAVEIEIRDEGRGMTAEFIRDGLFKPFKSTKEGGFGIGAYEAREMTTEMGGRLGVTSEPGAGTCFNIQFPRLAEVRD